MKKYFSLLIISLVAATLFNAPTAAAVTGSDWQAGRIMDDTVFFDGGTMSAGEIQAFLNAKVPSCDTNGSRPSEFGGPDSNGDGVVTRAEYGTSRGYPPPYVCLKDYYEHPTTKENNLQGRGIPSGAMSTAQIIASAAQTYNVSPKALLAVLQKESAGPLVTDTWPFWNQYRTAMGYGCPDTAPCDQQYYGFYNQMTNAARQFRNYANKPTSFRHKAYQNNDVLYNPNSGCGSSNVYIHTQATAGLYNYTPYQPNQAALNNLYGSGDSCSAYGNRNFWRIFNDWFGSTIGAPYQWAIESFTYSGGDNLIAVGQTETVTLKARNNGRLPWYNHGNHPVRLGTWAPANRASPLASGGWLSNSRPSNMQESVVQPGQVGTFTFQIAPNTAPGTFVEALNLVAENSQWMAWPGFSPTIQITNGYQWNIEDVIYEKGTGLMEPGTTQLITVKARNTGNVTWNKAGPAPVRLGTWQPQRPSAVATSNWLSQVRVADMNESTVAPGQVAGFQFYVTTPYAGNFYERFNLVAEGQTWLNDTNLTLYLRGASYGWQPLWHAHSTGTANIPRNTQFTITVKARNTGEIAWKKGSTFPVRMGTASPLNRGSAFYTPEWISDTRPATLQEDVVQPGQEGTFIIKAKTPATPGPWNERFTLVAEGVSWFNDPGFSFYVNVH